MKEGALLRKAGLIRTAVRDGFDAAMCIGLYDPDNIY